MSYLIECPETGELQCSPSLSGYDGWKVIREGAGAKPQPNCELGESGWTPVPGAKSAVDRRARFQAMTREELVDFLLDIIKRGDARLDALAARLDALENPPNA